MKSVWRDVACSTAHDGENSRQSFVHVGLHIGKCRVAAACSDSILFVALQPLRMDPIMASCPSSLTERSPLASLWPAETASSVEFFGAVELARRGGCSHRELRELIELGLVSKATGKGPAAKYFESHVEQLKAVLLAKDKLGLSKPELRSILDPDTPHRLRRQALSVERLFGPADGRRRVEQVALDLSLRLTRTGVLPDHLKSSAKKVALCIAETLRSEADRVESCRRSLTISMKLR